MKLRQLKLRLQTSDGPYGTTIDFPDGLVVIWADNSMGKSSCVKSILVALGMEAALTTNQSDLPLTPALTNRLEGSDGEILVTESNIFLEIENSSKKRVVIHRTVKGTRDHHLITVHDGPALSQPDQAYSSQDYFVNRSGGASREHGFHRFLESFLGWEIPDVPSYDGKDVHLYLQCLIPYFMVEQTRGWSTIQPPLPTHFRIREPGKRAVEFLLNLDAHRIALRRQELVQERADLESEWRVCRSEICTLAKQVAGEVLHVPLRPVSEWPPLVPPIIMITKDGKWVPIAQICEDLKVKIDALQHEIIPQVQVVASAVTQELQAAETELRREEAVLTRLISNLEMERAEVASIEQRLDAIKEDIQRNQDIETLRTLGAANLPSIQIGECPYCHQSIRDSLLPLEPEQKVMSIQENIDFLKEQRKTFQLVLTNGRRVIEGRELQVQAAQKESTDRRAKIRSLRQTLISDGRLPSIAAIRERLHLDDQLRQVSKVDDSFYQLLETLSDVAGRWQINQVEFGKLPADDTTPEDKGKLITWSKSIRDQLHVYGFKSLPIHQISISEDTYRPEHEGFDLQVDLFEHPKKKDGSLDLQTSISASDMIRTIWAYLHGLLELSRQVKTNCPGLIVFDEPRQQSTKNMSFDAFLKRASSAKEFNQQVILFTSEDRVGLRDSLEGVGHTFTEIEGRLIKKLTK